MNIDFHKFQNCGNDFIIIDHIGKENEKDKIKEIGKKILKKKFGIGANNLLYLHESGVADAFMRIYNISDTEGNNCGNGSLCVAKYLSEKTGKCQISLETKSGINKLKKLDNSAFELEFGAVKYGYFGKNELFNQKIMGYEGIIVNAGEPHLVINVNDIDSVNLQKIGDEANKCKNFQFGINVDLVEAVDRNTIRIRVYERSCFEETEACGTGSCCAAFVCKNKELVYGNTIKVKNKGGELDIKIEENSMYLIGKPKRVYRRLN